LVLQVSPLEQGASPEVPQAPPLAIGVQPPHACEPLFVLQQEDPPGQIEFPHGVGGGVVIVGFVLVVVLVGLVPVGAVVGPGPVVAVPVVAAVTVLPVVPPVPVAPVVGDDVCAPVGEGPTAVGLGVGG